MNIVYLNLTNGIESLGKIKGNIRFIRIQSTVCEQHRWDFIIQDLDNDFLMNVAIGNNVIVIDRTDRYWSRAQFQGVEFIRYVLNKYWLNVEYFPMVKRHNVEKYYEECYKRLEKRTLKKLDYFKKFLLTNEIKIKCVGGFTVHDGDYKFYRNHILKVAV